MIDRLIKNELLDMLQDTPAVAITGARQTGKTTLARVIEKEFETPTRYLDLEFPDDQAKLQNPVLFLEQYIDDCVILDEIHRMPELFPLLRSLIDRHRRPGRFLLLGSASPTLLRDSSESLAGRISYIELHPFNLLEIGKQTAWQTLFLRGGFPESLFARSLHTSSRWRMNFIQTYLERELPLLGLNSDVRILRKLLIMIAQSQGQILNMQNLATALGVSRPTVSKYIDFMEKAYILYRLEPWFVNLKKRLIKSPKVYLSDSGLFHSLMGLQDFEALTNSLSIGPSWEGFVINQTQSVLRDGRQLWFLRTHEGAEADIVITEQDRPVITAEIKWTNAPKLSKGFLNVTGYLGTTRNYIITPTADTYPVAENIHVTSLNTWLRKVT
ncbi:MAG: ATP-binding protein [Balneolales bacterium]